MKRVLVTGGNSGIGKEIVRLLGERTDYTIILGSRNIERGENAKSSFSDDIKNQIHVQQLDITDENSVDEAISNIQSQFNGLDILINNAGRAYSNREVNEGNLSFADQTPETFNVNYHSTLRMMDKFLPILKLNENPLIINVASRAGRLNQVSTELQERFSSTDLTMSELDELIESFKQGVANGNHKDLGFSNSNYGMSKLSLISGTKVKAHENPDVNFFSYCPGYCQTNMTKDVNAPRTAAEGAETALHLILSDYQNFESGTFWGEEHEIDW